MSLYLVVPLLVVIVLVQATVMPHLAVFGVYPSLPLLAVVSWSLLRGAREGMLWGFIAGVAVDLYSGAPFGAATLPLIMVGLLSGLGQATVFRAHVALPIVTMFLATIIYELLFLLIVRVSGHAVNWLDGFFRIILPLAAVNAVLTPIALGLMRILHARFGREEMEW